MSINKLYEVEMLKEINNRIARTIKVQRYQIILTNQ